MGRPTPPEKSVSCMAYPNGVSLTRVQDRCHGMLVVCKHGCDAGGDVGGDGSGGGGGDEGDDWDDGDDGDDGGDDWDDDWDDGFKTECRVFTT